MFYSNSLNLIQVGGGTQVKQGDLGSKFSYKLANEKDQELDDFDKEVARINLVLNDKIVFTTTATVDNSTVTFNIDKAIPVGLYFLEIKIRDYIFPSDKQTIIFVDSGAAVYKELVPNYDVNMTLDGILSDLAQKGAEITAARGSYPNLKGRLDNVDKKQQQTTAQLAQKANKDEVTNVMTPKGTLAYASLPTSGNEVGWYYYCPDGDGIHGAGNYVWNGTSWYFGGTGDEGYNLLKKDIDTQIHNFLMNDEFTITNELPHVGTINIADGTVNKSVKTSKHTDYVDISEYKGIWVTQNVFNSYVDSGLAFYDANKQFIKGYRNPYEEDITVTSMNFYYEVPPEAVYIRACYKIAETIPFRIYTYDFESYDNTIKEIPVIFENGGFNGSGTNTSSENAVRSVNYIPIPNRTNIVIIFPHDVVCIANIIESNGKRINKTYKTATFLKCSTHENEFIRLAFKYKDGTSIQNDFENIKSNIHIYVGETKNPNYDITVSAYDSADKYKQKSDLILDGIVDTEAIQMLFGDKEGIKCLFYPGNYNVTRLSDTKYDKKSAFYTYQGKNDSQRRVEFHGYVGGSIGGFSYSLGTNTVNFVISKELHSSITEESAIFLVPRADKAEDTTASFETAIKMVNINVLGYGYDKPIVYFDFTHSRSTMIDTCNIRSDGKTGKLENFVSPPNEKLTGFRVGHGSNNGAQNYVKHCRVYSCHTGYSNCGEHFIFEDDLAHHCYVGFAFGDKLTRTNYEHPNVMIGCSVEGSKRLMTLSRYGQTEISETIKPSNTLICIGLSTENSFYDPETGTKTTTLPILEITRGAYGGHIDGDFADRYATHPLVEENSCINMEWRDNRVATRGFIHNTPRCYNVQVGTEYFVTNESKLYPIYATKEHWVKADGTIEK